MTSNSTLDADDKMIGRKVGGYTISRRVGQGGMGIVYEAKHERIDQRCAVKVLHKDLSADEKVLQRFFNEAKAISVAQHSSIVKIFDFGQLDDGVAYIMMEFLEGEPLLARMEKAQRQGQDLPFLLVVELGRQLAAALATIHEKGIVHRDLKPENIFIVPDPVAPLGERVKLLDFGIAKFLDGPVRKTTVGMILGTPLYMSPEQCEGSEDLDSKVDVYALGVILYEMIAGRLPFVADTSTALMRQHMFKDPPPLHEQVDDLPPALGELVHHMLAKKPDERPNMEEVTERLSALVPLLGGAVTSPTVQPAMRSSGRRRPITVKGEGQAPDPFAMTLAGNEASPSQVDLESPSAESSPRPVSQPGKKRSTSNNTGKSLQQTAEAALPMSTTGTTPAARNRLPLLIAALVVVLGIGLAATWLRSPHSATSAPTSAPSSPSSAAVDKGVPTPPPAAQEAPPPPATKTEPKPEAATASPSEVEWEEGSDSHKGHIKKLKGKGGTKKHPEAGESGPSEKKEAAPGEKKEPSRRSDGASGDKDVDQPWR